MSCVGCDSSPSGQEWQLSQIRTEAKLYAIKEQKNIAIFKEGNSFRFAEHAAAVANNVPIIEILSFY